ncbi:MAG: AraC family transcriptional regulator [Kiritimatiellae bacterium]|nr:AraC family transcriptional regulator [Kiritimatiellia bacterium]
MKAKLKSIHRSTPAPAANLPFGVRSAGHYRLAPDFKSNVFITDFIQIFWCASGAGAIIFNGSERILRKNQAAIYFPRMEHRFFSTAPEWEFYWCTLDGKLAEVWVSAFGLNAGIYNTGPAPANLFRRLFKAVGNPAPEGGCHAITLTSQLLEKMWLGILRGGRGPVSEVQAAVENIHAGWNDPALSVKGLARALKIHRSILSRRFRESLGISPSEYITRLRIQHAMALLHGSQKTIAEIAEACGWIDQHYFARLFKKRFGISPSRVRCSPGRSF